MLLLRTLLGLLLLSLASPAAAFSQLVNGQSFTFGLSIIDAPFPNSPYTVGSQLPIAIEVRVPSMILSSSSAPHNPRILTSDIDLTPTRFDLLEIYMVSAETGMNYTVSSGPGLLENEDGSVRHLNWPIPTCTKGGNYNLTFYESSHVNDTAYFIITPIGVTINEGDKHSDSDDEKCKAMTNDLQPQPQDDAPLPQIPFLPDDPMPIETKVPDSTRAQPTPTIYTVTVVESGATITFPTVTETPMPVTVVVVQETTITTTQNGEPVTSTVTAMYTTTGMAGDGGDLEGFFPVNGALGDVRTWTGWSGSVVFVQGDASQALGDLDNLALLDLAPNEVIQHETVKDDSRTDALSGGPGEKSRILRNERDALCSIRTDDLRKLAMWRPAAGGR
ncbi:uncharacterized protein SCHCODRAFT_02489321 [Schizophyllum commune H4-8]|uniref:Uncharacterized protein n=1 Tax=Schizophyllum commune (strain H4-8 / FGSC 9210) TaxID=578458 RepID=D8PKM3_SCHCM|nr:uncharacterized protein SCHCODRAFT_02489321 [Schizophyllum commune H4-8]KAI5897645.1 hypothetical protein SCHCODRAFT_02489321 [Schizophyllum commune H4-8]